MKIDMSKVMFFIQIFIMRTMKHDCLRCTDIQFKKFLLCFCELIYELNVNV